MDKDSKLIAEAYLDDVPRGMQRGFKRGDEILIMRGPHKGKRGIIKSPYAETGAFRTAQEAWVVLNEPLRPGETSKEDRTIAVDWDEMVLKKGGYVPTPGGRRRRISDPIRPDTKPKWLGGEAKEQKEHARCHKCGSINVFERSKGVLKCRKCGHAWKGKLYESQNLKEADFGFRPYYESMMEVANEKGDRLVEDIKALVNSTIEGAGHDPVKYGSLARKLQMDVTNAIVTKLNVIYPGREI